MFGWRFRPAPDAPDLAENAFAIVPENTRVVMVFALQMDGNGLGEAADRLSRRMPRDTFVFVHSALDFRPLMARKLAFEMVPSRAQMAAYPDLAHWPSYLEDRRALLVAKWRPARAIAYGPTLAEYATTAPDRTKATAEPARIGDV